MADKVVITKAKVTALADAIRNLYGTTATYTLEEIKQKLLDGGKPEYITVLYTQTPLAAQCPTYTGSNFYTFASGDTYLKAGAYYIVPPTKYGKIVIYRLVLTDAALAAYVDLAAVYSAMKANNFVNCTSVFTREMTADETVAHGVFTYNLKIAYTSSSAHNHVILISVLYDAGGNIMHHDIYNYGKAFQNGQADTQYAYTGSYSVTPSAVPQTLPVKGKVLRNDITVFAAPPSPSSVWLGPYDMSVEDDIAFVLDGYSGYEQVCIYLSNLGIAIDEEGLTFDIQMTGTLGGDYTGYATLAPDIVDALEGAVITVQYDAIGNRVFSAALFDGFGSAIDTISLSYDGTSPGEGFTSVRIDSNAQFSGSATAQVYIK